MATSFLRLFEKLKHFDALINKADNYKILLDLIDDYLKNEQSLTDNERVFFAYILSERAYSQGYEMGYNKAYETSDFVQYFFNVAFKIIQTILKPNEDRYLEYKKMAKA